VIAGSPSSSIWRVAVIALALAAASLTTHAAASTRDALQPDLPAVLERASRWVEVVPVNVDTLESLDVTSKKSLAEVLECCWTLERHGTRPAAMLARARTLADETRRAGYHDQADCDSATFHHASMSYLRVAWLLDRLGVDTRVYRDSIRTMSRRLSQSMASRGAWQRAMLEGYQRYFGLVGAVHRPGPLDSGLVARRLPLRRFDVDHVYDLTHEVYAVYESPIGHPAHAFTPADRAYLAATLPPLLGNAIARDDVDLAAELACAMGYLGMEHEVRWRDAIRWLASRQNADGSWGTYEEVRLVRGALVEQMAQLHTTLVAIEAFEQSERSHRTAGAGMGPG